MSRRKKSRVSVTLPESTKKVIENLAEEYGLTVSGFIQHMIARGLTLEAIIKDGGKIYLLNPDGEQVLLATKNGHFIGYQNLME